MMTYQETLAWMHTMPRTRTAPTLERIRVSLAMLGNPEKKLAGRFIHVTGTNGKGSFCAFTSSALQRAGYKTGRFISPFIMEIRERMEINGVPISEEEVITLGSRIRAAVERMTAETGLTPLEFELVTAMGLLWFAEQDCDLVVLEVGIGGMHDPTNVVVPLLSVIMRVDYDHTELLGDTLTAIAANKAGIIKENAPCVLYADNEPEVIETVRARCKETHSSLILPESAETGVIEAVPGRLVFSYRGEQYTLHLSGLYQLQNALCAIEVLRTLPILGYPVSGEDIRLGLGDATFPARFEVLKAQDTVILDGAHNGSGRHAMRAKLVGY
ncbi:MAG: bifunctional folylpolyglutamate synthase/dihydrofolate synthase, partial [Clostridia bacterium]|nr:bifunctional folylpolyglutamate synthase/dihydrofolate synthase [Clostridia bacterium]